MFSLLLQNTKSLNCFLHPNIFLSKKHRNMNEIQGYHVVHAYSHDYLKQIFRSTSMI